MERLDVYLCGKKVGALERSDRGLTFRYLDEYLAEPNAAVVSGTLPLSAAVYEERGVMAFFSNHLPAESLRRRIAEILKLTPEDTLYNEYFCMRLSALCGFDFAADRVRKVPSARIGG